MLIDVGKIHKYVSNNNIIIINFTTILIALPAELMRVIISDNQMTLTDTQRVACVIHIIEISLVSSVCRARYHCVAGYRVRAYSSHCCITPV